MVDTARQLLDLSSFHAQLQAQARDVASQWANRAREVRQHLLDQHEMHPQLWASFCDHGWPGLVLPTEYGGTEGGLLGMSLVLEAFAEQGIVLWMPVLSTAIAHAIVQAGPQPASRQWCTRVACGQALLAMAVTESHSGHNIFRTRTEIRCEGDHFVVNGLKQITSGLDVVDRMLVFGRATGDDDGTARGYTTVLVDPHLSGVTMSELPMRYREGVRQYQVELNDVIVPADDLVGAEGHGLAVIWPFTAVERILTSALCLGTAAHGLTGSVARAKQRVTSGTAPIGAHQAIAHPLAKLHTQLAAIRLFVYSAASRFDAGVDAYVVAGEANMAKVLTADLAFDSYDHTMQVMGVDAWDERNGWIDNYLDARLSRSGPVSNEFALNFIAEHILGLPAH
ncbi:acyl-CoA dehydrogenase family protein [Mycobacterium sp.]|jgi:alkylation response protein AidB-like acyl-CoA dehydrogenase|uniref:acyl-CoA dehydrogenase family protein n=1 Tax=Mycobacterium sp. TaxID=1785 RepID=UPI0028BE866A|nr:acyl-CoA dehydrogenase family protein [Mycobacterium sp.]